MLKDWRRAQARPSTRSIWFHFNCTIVTTLYDDIMNATDWIGRATEMGSALFSCQVLPTNSETLTIIFLILPSPSTRLSPYHLLCHYLCSEPMDFTYYSIRRRGMTQGGEWVGLMING